MPYGNDFMVAEGGIVQLTVCCQWTNQIGLNIVYYTLDNGVGPTDAFSFLTSYDAALAALYIPTIGSDAVYYGTRLIPCPRGAVAAAYENINAKGGTAAGLTLPSQVSGIITKNSALIGRANRGRAYIPFPSVTFQNAGYPSAVYQNLIQQIGNALFTTDIYADAAGNNVVVTPILSTPLGVKNVEILDSTARLKWATQRRRGDYGRPNVLPW